MIVDYVANNIRLASNKAHNISHPVEYGRLQIPLIWVCRNFRAVVYSQTSISINPRAVYLGKDTESTIPRAIELIRLNVPTLQYVNVLFYFRANLSGLIYDNNGCVEYPRLHTLAVKLDLDGAIPRRCAFEGAAPFPNLCRLIGRGDYSFGDDLVLLRGNAATLEYLQLDLTLKLTVALIQQKHIYTY
ncbi:hypothetical protein GGI13_000874 [Coemansia sp. RSA 455]|nr:hypothetical protein GGI13_000874 [Coemansia sp. RSA 455]